jgi:hypothetical protein
VEKLNFYPHSFFLNHKIFVRKPLALRFGDFKNCIHKETYYLIKNKTKIHTKIQTKVWIIKIRQKPEKKTRQMKNLEIFAECS